MPQGCKATALLREFHPRRSELLPSSQRTSPQDSIAVSQHDLASLALTVHLFSALHCVSWVLTADAPISRLLASPATIVASLFSMASNSQNEAAQEAEHDLASQRILAELLTQIRTDQPRVADSEASTHQNGSFCPGCMPLDVHRGMIRRIKEALNADLLEFQAMLHALIQGIVQDVGRVPCPLGKMFIEQDPANPLAWRDDGRVLELHGGGGATQVH
ncbi:hypothetical protein PCL_07224 [Purpureocillium lilacinum]|uniref:Uncharacterized protein n=1 Tax=Purpureocillium lilacinum TaxID=33203 RepID=A0A2U3DSR0_PURLI|nr:hypothetical protein Purlil1_9554 [Purpureocillium lilacinum]PWI65301.1 hypothetical protein PCL_07224 [Purpureocillium lilacinum]